MVMLRYSFRIESNRLGSIAKKLPQEIQTIVDATLADVETAAKLSMQGGKSGRLYRRGANRMHQASAAGQAPAMDYGHLTNSIQRKLYKTVIGGEVYTNSDYAEALEFGTRKMAPRPFLAPALEAQREAFYAKLKTLDGRL